MFELMTRAGNAEVPGGRTVSPMGDRGEVSGVVDEAVETMDDVDDVEQSDIDADLDETLINDAGIRCDNPILARFLQDAQYGIRYVIV